MTLDLLHRIRWANVARAAAVALALLLALAWPRLRANPDAPLPPAVEPASAVPVKPAAAKATRVARPVHVKDKKAAVGRARARAAPERPAVKRRTPRRHRHARHRRPRSPRIAVPAAAPAPAYVAPPAAAVPAAEFRP